MLSAGRLSETASPDRLHGMETILLPESAGKFRVYYWSSTVSYETKRSFIAANTETRSTAIRASLYPGSRHSAILPTNTAVDRGGA